MATKLEIYNIALGHLGSVRLDILNENRPDRREIDAKYAISAQTMLEKACWVFALRTQQWEADTDLEPLFGRPYVFTLPDEFCRIRLIATDERQENEDLTYKREGRLIYSDHPTLYVTFVSNDADYGLDLGKYPALYTKAFGAQLALDAALPINKSEATRNNRLGIAERDFRIARGVDAVDERVKRKPVSSWVRSRFNGSDDQRREPT